MAAVVAAPIAAAAAVPIPIHDAVDSRLNELDDVVFVVRALHIVAKPPVTGARTDPTFIAESK